MNGMTCGSSASASYQLRFGSLHQAEIAYVFPCDSAGHVDIDALSDRARNDYFFARTVIGRDFRSPQILRND